ncbi:MAG: UPF0149 family protein [Candidatus Methylophosphatis roskildensis]
MSDDELIELDTLLASPAFKNEAMSVVELQGLFCAIASGPEVIDDEETWLSFALGEAPDYESPEQARRVAELMRRYCEETAQALAAGEPPQLVLANQSEEALAESYEAWAGGYLDGMEMSEDEWFEYAESDEEAEFLVTHLWPIDILSGLAAQEADEVGDPWPPEGMTVEELIADARDELAESVLALYQFWRAKRPLQTIRRNGDKVGRNEPCPCGSGKKYKQCCGKADG